MSRIVSRDVDSTAARGLAGFDNELSYRPEAGGGSVVSWVVRHSTGPDGATAREVTEVIELDRGPWWWGPIVDVDPDAVHVGFRVQVDSENHADSETVPVFHPE